MTNFTETISFDTEVNQLEITDFYGGGLGGTANAAPQALANRTAYLLEKITEKHNSDGSHDLDALLADLANALSDAELDENADIRETKLALSMLGEARPFGLGVYTNTDEFIQDLRSVSESTSEGDLLRSYAEMVLFGEVYQRIYGGSQDILPGSSTLSGYDIVGQGGLACLQEPVSSFANKMLLSGDVQKFLDKFNLNLITPEELTFPEADAYCVADPDSYDTAEEPRVDLLYLRMELADVSTSDIFYTNGYQKTAYANTWSDLSSEERRAAIVEAANNLYQGVDNLVYQAQYTFVVEKGKQDLLACGYALDSTDTYLYRLGDYAALPICTVTRRNQGAWHPAYNKNGSGFLPRLDDSAVFDTRFSIEDSDQLLTENNSFASWDTGTGVSVSDGDTYSTLTGAVGAAETVFKTQTGLSNDTRYVFAVELAKTALDATERVLTLRIDFQDVSNTSLAVHNQSYILTPDFKYQVVVADAPDASVDHAVLSVGVEDAVSCDYTFYARNALFCEDNVTKATGYDLTSTDTATSTVAIAGDHTAEFPAEWSIVLEGTGSGGDTNDGTYTVDSAAFDGTYTSIVLAESVQFNTGNTGQLHSKTWHYVQYCFENVAEGVGANPTGAIASQNSGRIDGKFFDEIDADSVTDARNYIASVTGPNSSNTTLSTPTITSIPLTVYSESTVDITISNYSADYTYNIEVSGGYFVQNQDTITWTLPAGEQDCYLNIYASDSEGAFSAISTVEVSTTLAVVEADAAISEIVLSADDFEVLDQTQVANSRLVLGDNSGNTVTEPYYQNEGDGDWVQAVSSVIHSAESALDITTGNSTLTSLEINTAESVAAGEVFLLAYSSSETATLHTFETVSSVADGDSEIYTCTDIVPALTEIPVKAWSASQAASLHQAGATEDEHIAYRDVYIALDAASTTTDTLVGTHAWGDLWTTTGAHNKVGIRVDGIDHIVDILTVESTTSEGDYRTTYTLTIEAQSATPTMTWKPAQFKQQVALSVASSTASEIVSSVYSEGIPLRVGDPIWLTVAGVSVETEIDSYSETQHLHSEHSVDTTSIAGLAGENKWFGGVKAMNGKIYCAPYDSDSVLIIDPETDTVDTTSITGLNTANYTNLRTNNGKWADGTLAPSGKIFCIPHHENCVLILDPETSSIDTTSLTSTDTSYYKWSGGVLADNGKIYGVPYSSEYFLVLDPEAETTEEIRVPTPAEGSYKWWGGVLADNGKIYCIPHNADTVLVIDTDTDTAVHINVTNIGTTSARWRGGVKAPDGKIYSLPHYASDDILVIDPETGTAEALSTDLTNQGWAGQVLAPNGYVYGIPADTSIVGFFHYTEPSNVEDATITGLPLDADKWYGGALADNGKIYAVPYNAENVLIIDPEDRVERRQYTITTPLQPAPPTQAWLPGTEDGYVNSPTLGELGIASSTSTAITTTSMSQQTLNEGDPLTLKVGTSILESEVVDSVETQDVVAADTAYLLGLSNAYKSYSEFYDGYCTALPATNGKIYCVPNDADYVLVVSPEADSVSAYSIDITGLDLQGYEGNQWVDGVLAPNGKIYCVPGWSFDVLVIDTVLDSVSKITVPGDLSTLDDSYPLWGGGVLAPNGKIYCSPCNAEDMLVIDTENDTVSTSIFTGLGSGLNKWHGGVLASNGKIYFAPVYNTAFLIVDPEAESVDRFGFNSQFVYSTNTWWHEGILAEDGKIYFFPGLSASSTDLLILDPETETLEIQDGVDWGVGGVKLVTNELAPNGKVYFIEDDALLSLDLETKAVVSTSLSGLTEPDSGCSGCIAADGRLYVLQDNVDNVMVIDPEGLVTGYSYDITIPEQTEAPSRVWLQNDTSTGYASYTYNEVDDSIKATAQAWDISLDNIRQLKFAFSGSDSTAALIGYESQLTREI